MPRPRRGERRTRLVLRDRLAGSAVTNGPASERRRAFGLRATMCGRDTQARERTPTPARTPQVRSRRRAACKRFAWRRAHGGQGHRPLATPFAPTRRLPLGPGMVAPLHEAGTRHQRTKGRTTARSQIAFASEPLAPGAVSYRTQPRSPLPARRPRSPQTLGAVPRAERSLVATAVNVISDLVWTQGRALETGADALDTQAP